MSILQDNQVKLLSYFSTCADKEEIYRRLISLGEALPPLPVEAKIEANRVYGCQSLLYLIHTGTKEALFYQADSDALISKGIASLLTGVYHGVSAEEIVIGSMTLFEEIDLVSLLSPSRLTGLSDLQKKIKQIALKYLL